jgi:hypothetical protein
MHNDIKFKFPLLAGACALALTFAPSAMAAGGGGHAGGMGGMGAMHTSPMTTFPSTPHPMPAPPDHPSNPSSPPDTNPHAHFNKLNPGSGQQATPATTSESTHASQTVTNPTRPEPVTGTRIPPSVPRQHVPPPGQD